MPVTGEIKICEITNLILAYITVHYSAVLLVTLQIICFYVYMHCGYISCVRIGGITSDWFDVKQGVHQGAPFSMLLFEIFINPMLEELKASRFGACIADIPAACPRFADD